MSYHAKLEFLATVNELSCLTGQQADLALGEV